MNLATTKNINSMKKIGMYITLIFFLMVSCKGIKNINENKSNNDLTIQNHVYVMDIVETFEVLDTTQYNPNYEGIVEELMSNNSKTIFVHDDSRVSKITFNEEGRTVMHLFYDKDSSLLKYYSEIQKGEPYFTQFNMDTLFHKDSIPIMKQKIKDDGILTIDSTTKFSVVGYDCFEVRFSPDENLLGKFYLSNQIPKLEGILGVMMNTQFDFSLKTVQESRELGLRVIKQPKDRRVDKLMEKYLILNSSSYDLKE